MDFGAALILVKNGRKMRRRGWNGSGMFIGGYPGGGEKDGFLCEDFIYLKTAYDTLIPWVPSQSDLLSSDWEVASDAAQDVSEPST